MNMMAVTRVDRIFNDLGGRHDVIPRGPYCYSISSIVEGEGGMPVIKTCHCPYLALVGEEGGYCALLKETDNLLLADACKLCGVNED